MVKGFPTLLFRYLRHLTVAGDAVELPDRELVQRFADEHNEAAFTVLVQRHGGMVLGVCRRVLGHEQDAEDVFQAVFLVLSRKARGLRSKEAVGPWLFGVARRLALRARQQRRSKHARTARVGERCADSLLDELTVREAQSVLDEELARLPERDRGPLVLCYLQGLTRDEAAKRLGCPLGTLKSRLERAREALQKRLTRRGMALDAVLATLLLTGTSAAAPSTNLVTATAKAGVAFACGSAGGGVVGVKAAVLAAGALKSVLSGKKIAAICLLMAAVCVGLGLSTSWFGSWPSDEGQADQAIAQKDERTKRRVQAQHSARKEEAIPPSPEVRVKEPGMPREAVQPEEPRLLRLFLDLQPYANQKLNENFAPDEKGNNLAGLPAGGQTLAGVKFNIGEGMIQLRGKGSLHPLKVEGINVGTRFSKLYLLHATQWGAEKIEKNDGIAGYYTVKYEDHSQETIPIVYGKDVRDWWYRESLGPGRAEVAWKGTNEYAEKRNGATIRLYLTRWINPKPARKVVSIDFSSTNSDVAPFCVAMTIEGCPKENR